MHFFGGLTGLYIKKDGRKHKCYGKTLLYCKWRKLDYVLNNDEKESLLETIKYACDRDKEEVSKEKKIVMNKQKSKKRKKQEATECGKT